MSISPSIHVSSFMKQYEELLKLSQDPEKFDRLTDRLTDWLTDWQTERKPEVPSGETGRGQLKYNLGPAIRFYVRILVLFSFYPLKKSSNVLNMLFL